LVIRDSVTPNQDFIISPHAACKDLYIAAGGSFHGWKFLPIIGKYVVQMLDGTLDPVLSDKWAWNRSDAGGACASYAPQRDMKSVVELEMQRAKV
jgi:sarcosine oxidase/L-pipecolate oxidase